MSDKYHLYLRPVTEQDLEIIHSWRIKPEVYTMYLAEKKSCSWIETNHWWNNLGKTFVFMVMMTNDAYPPVYWRGRRIGLMWMSFNEDIPVIGGYIGDIMINSQDIIMQALRLLLEAVRRRCGNTYVLMDVNWGNSVFLDKLGKDGWQVNSEIDENTLEMRYNVVVNE